MTIFFALLFFLCGASFLYHFIKSFFERDKSEEEIFARDKKIYASYWGAFLALGISAGLRDNTIGFLHDIFISIGLGLMGFTLFCLFQMLVFKKNLKKVALISFISIFIMFILVNAVTPDIPDYAEKNVATTETAERKESSEAKEEKSEESTSKASSLPSNSENKEGLLNTIVSDAKNYVQERIDDEVYIAKISHDGQPDVQIYYIPSTKKEEKQGFIFKDPGYTVEVVGKINGQIIKSWTFAFYKSEKNGWKWSLKKSWEIKFGQKMDTTPDKHDWYQIKNDPTLKALKNKFREVGIEEEKVAKLENYGLNPLAKIVFEETNNLTDNF